MNYSPMVYGQKEQKFGAQDKNMTVHWKTEIENKCHLYAISIQFLHFLMYIY